jgi:hypothetical protein
MTGHKCFFSHFSQLPTPAPELISFNVSEIAREVDYREDLFGGTVRKFRALLASRQDLQRKSQKSRIAQR